MEKVINIDKVAFHYENGMNLIIEGEEAAKFSEWFFADAKRYKQFNWSIQEKKPNLLKRMLRWNPWMKQ